MPLVLDDSALESAMTTKDFQASCFLFSRTESFLLGSICSLIILENERAKCLVQSATKIL